MRMKYTQGLMLTGRSGMRARSVAVLAVWLGAFGLLCVTTSAFAAPKGKKAASTQPKSTQPKSTQPKSTDDLMEDSMKPSKKSKADKASDADSDDKAADKAAETKKKEAEAAAEPDAWEKPPAEEEKAPPKKAKPAEKPVGDGRSLEIGLMLGYGFRTEKSFNTDPYGLGVGLHVGYEFDMHLFASVGYQYFLGSSKDTPQVVGPTLTSSANYMFIYGEVGYDVWFDKIILRPSMLLGLGLGKQDPDPRVNGPFTHKGFLLAPGMTVLYTMNSVFIGGDARVQLVLGGKNESGFILGVTGGLRF